jgi:hypothetical protein
MLAGSALAGAAALIAATGVAVSSAGAASTATLPALPIGDLTQVVADGVSNHVYLATTDGIVVTNMAGGLVKRLDAGESVGHLALNGNTLYAVIPGAHEVASFNTKTLGAAATYVLPAADAPSGLAYQGGKIWVSYTAAAAGAIGSFTPGSAAASRTRAARSG